MGSAASSAASGAFDFTELSGNDWSTRHAVQLHHPALVAFWRSDCTPCRAEILSLQKLSSVVPALIINLVALEDAQHVTRLLAHSVFPDTMHVMIAQQNGGEVLKQFGDMKQLLPFSAFLNKAGKVCTSHLGILGTQRIQQWMKQCSH